MTDSQFLINSLMGIGAIVGPFVVRVIFERVKDAKDAAAAAHARAEASERALAEHKLYVAENLLRGDNFEKFEERLWKELSDLRALIATKADKNVRPLGS